MTGEGKKGENTSGEEEGKAWRERVINPLKTKTFLVSTVDRIGVARRCRGQMHPQDENKISGA